jgi:hypothetical protein
VCTVRTSARRLVGWSRLSTGIYPSTEMFRIVIQRSDKSKCPPRTGPACGPKSKKRRESRAVSRYRGVAAAVVGTVGGGVGGVLGGRGGCRKQNQTTI